MHYLQGFTVRVDSTLGDVVQLVRTLPFCCTLSRALLSFLRQTEAQNLHDLAVTGFCVQRPCQFRQSGVETSKLGQRPNRKFRSRTLPAAYANYLPEIAVYPLLRAR